LSKYELGVQDGYFASDKVATSAGP
jgi:hypothetical protein